MSVDFPTPEEPSNASVRPGASHGARASMPSPQRALSVITAALDEIDSTSDLAAAGSGWRSVLFCTMTGSAPLYNVTAR